ncbi:hypothetical protein FPV67DRAFT_1171427 [Lyophyllum atratum]|nr:hypothetical protein FPV67DRAFT_1171427 [Lyophyllum atratum]
MGRHNDVQEIYKVIHALMVIHNICIDYGDVPMELLDEGLEDGRGIAVDDEGNIDPDELGYGGITVTPEDMYRVPVYETDEWQKEAGKVKRDRYLNQLFPVENYQ